MYVELSQGQWENPRPAKGHMQPRYTNFLVLEPTVKICTAATVGTKVLVALPFR